MDNIICNKSDIMDNIVYDINKPWLTLDPWQKEYIETEGNCFLICGRQSGKTTAAAIKFGTRAVTKAKQVILMIAFTEKQAYNLFFKTLMFLEAKHPFMIKKGKDKPTQHRICLKNGSIIMCYAAGEGGAGLRTYTCTSIVIDEAAPMAREVFIAVSPMLSVTGGSMDLLSTPRGKEGYFYECSKRNDFKKFYVSAEECPRHKKEFLEAEKSRMSKLEYAQEYLAMFLDELKRLYSDELINEICVLRQEDFKKGNYYLGVDVAGMGEDLTTFEIVRKINDEQFEQIENITTSKTYTTETVQKILDLESVYKFKQIGIDDGGVGFGVFSELLRENKTRSKTTALNNASRPLNRDETKKKRLLKEDMYFNLLSLMEHKKILLLDDYEVKASLASIQWELVVREGTPTKTRIFGRDTHIAEGLIRACWLAYQDKHLNIFAY